VDNPRIRELMSQIEDSGEINPLIVVKDKEGLYVLEGGHRFDALRLMGVKSIPAQIVIDNESLAEQGGEGLQQAASVQTDSPEFKAWFGKSKVVDEKGKPLVLYHGTTRQNVKFLSQAYLHIFNIRTHC